MSCYCVKICLEFVPLKLIPTVCLLKEDNIHSVNFLGSLLNYLDYLLLVVISKGTTRGTRRCRKPQIKKKTNLEVRLVVKWNSIIKGIFTCTQKDKISLAVSVPYVLVVFVPLSFLFVVYKFIAGPKKPHTKVFWGEISVNALAMIKISANKNLISLKSSY